MHFCIAEKTAVRKIVTVGKDVTLPCRTTRPTPVDWYYLPSEYQDGEFICSSGTILIGYKSRFALDRSSFGDFSLIIHSVTKADAGVYICIEQAGVGTKHQVTLTVIGKISRFYLIKILIAKNDII